LHNNEAFNLSLKNFKLMPMGAPKKPVNKKVEPKSAGEEEDDLYDEKPKKKAADEDFDGPLDDLGYENFDYDDDDDF
jgi:hypothetical protein